MEPEETNLSLSWRTCTVAMLTSIFVATPEWALATSTDPMGDVFCIAALWITGPAGKAIATICVAITGLGAMLGKITWSLVMVVGVNVATILGAATVVDSLAGGSPTTPCDVIIQQRNVGLVPPPR
jgi:type IV secretory pathway VirB2 component (pilin)